MSDGRQDFLSAVFVFGGRSEEGKNLKHGSEDPHVSTTCGAPGVLRGKGGLPVKHRDAKGAPQDDVRR
jgi:hypothetical protein